MGLLWYIFGVTREEDPAADREIDDTPAVYLALKWHYLQVQKQDYPTPVSEAWKAAVENQSFYTLRFFDHMLFCNSYIRIWWVEDFWAACAELYDKNYTPGQMSFIIH